MVINWYRHLKLLYILSIYLHYVLWIVYSLITQCVYLMLIVILPSKSMVKLSSYEQLGKVVQLWTTWQSCPVMNNLAKLSSYEQLGKVVQLWTTWQSCPVMSNLAKLSSYEQLGKVVKLWTTWQSCSVMNNLAKLSSYEQLGKVV